MSDALSEMFERIGREQLEAANLQIEEAAEKERKKTAKRLGISEEQSEFAAGLLRLGRESDSAFSALRTPAFFEKARQNPENEKRALDMALTVNKESAAEFMAKAFSLAAGKPPSEGQLGSLMQQTAARQEENTKQLFYIAARNDVMFLLSPAGLKVNTLDYGEYSRPSGELKKMTDSANLLLKEAEAQFPDLMSYARKVHADPKARDQQYPGYEEQKAAFAEWARNHSLAREAKLVAEQGDASQEVETAAGRAQVITGLINTGKFSSATKMIVDRHYQPGARGNVADAADNSPDAGVVMPDVPRGLASRDTGRGGSRT